MTADAIIDAYLRGTEEGLRCQKAGDLTLGSGQLYFYCPDTEELDGYFGGTEGSLPKGPHPVYVVTEPGEDTITRMVLIVLAEGSVPTRWEWREHGPAVLAEGPVAFGPEWTDWEPEIDEALDEAGGLDEDGPAFRPVFETETGDTVLVVNIETTRCYPYECFDADGRLVAILVNFTEGDAPS